MAGNVGRPREYDEDKVLSEITALFWKQGYEATGLSDIMTATGLQKGSLYKAYGSKRHMYMCSLQHYEREVVDAGVNGLTSSDVPPPDRLAGFLAAPIEAAWDQNDRRGCFLCNAATDDAAMDDETRKLIDRGYRKLEDALIVPIGQMHPEWDVAKVRQTAQMVLTLYSGLRVMARAAVERDRLEGARDATMIFVDG